MEFNVRDNFYTGWTLRVDSENHEISIFEFDRGRYSGVITVSEYKQGNCEYLKNLKYVATRISELDELRDLLEEESVERRIVDLIINFRKELNELK